MKLVQLRLAVLFTASAAFASASVPTVQSFSVAPIYLGGSATLTASVADSGGGLLRATFYAAGPGLNGWQNIGGVAVNGAQATAQIGWAPTLPGLYTVEVAVFNADPNYPAIAYQLLDVFAGSRTLSPFVILGGSSQIFDYPGELITTTDTSTLSTSVKNTGNLILWSGGRVKLEPGFHAEPGSFFWVAIDHNGNGYSDIEETQQHFILGVPDAWLADQALSDPGINLSQPISTWAYTAAQLQAAYSGGYKSTDIVNAAKTTTYSLVLTTPSGFYGVQTSSWSITGVP